MNLVERAQPKRKVIIEIQRGIAQIIQCPDDVEVEIVDCDNDSTSDSELFDAELGDLANNPFI